MNQPAAERPSQPNETSLSTSTELIAVAESSSLTLIVDASGQAKPEAAAARTIASAYDRVQGSSWNEILVIGVDRLPRTTHSIGTGQTTGSGDTPRLRVVTKWTKATGHHLVFIRAGCELADNAADQIRYMLTHNRTLELGYFDSTGYNPLKPAELIDPCHRPAFSPERLRAQMYLGQMFVVAHPKALAFDPGGSLLVSPSHSTLGRLAARCATVAHLPQVLYRYPVDATNADIGESGGASVRLADHQARLDDEEFPATAVLRPGSESIIDLEPRLVSTPKVSIIIPTNGSSRLIDEQSVVLCLQAVESIVARTTYADYELVIVITPGAPAGLVVDLLAAIESQAEARQPTVRFCRDDRPFNFSDACNRGAVAAAGDVLVFLNDDTKVESANWLDRLIMYATRPNIGAVGARLLYGDGTIQHAGIWARGGHPAHRYAGFVADHPGYMDALSVPQNCLAVTGACLAVEADKFVEVGGFSPEFPSSYNDVDLCLKLDDVGYRTVVDPTVVLSHYEASTRDPVIEDWELEVLHRRWRSVLNADRFDNPHHLAPESEEFPAPDPMVTEQKRLAGWLDFHPRLWPPPQLTLENQC